jgi:hypothetical protein
MFTVKEFSDLIYIIDNQPEWRHRLRRALFPEIDVAKSFERLTAIIERLDKRVETGLAEAKTDREIDFVARESGFAKAKADREAGFAEAKADREHIKKDVRQLEERMEAGFAEAKAAREAGFAEAKAAREAGFAEAKADREHIKKRLDKLEHDVGDLKGLSLEQFYRDKAPSIFGRYVQRGRFMTDQVIKQLHDAESKKIITETELDHVMEADLLWGGRLWNTEDETQIVLVVEASWLVAETDVERAVNRANILRKIGLNALAVVAGREWKDDMAEMARNAGVVMTTNGRVDRTSWQIAISQISG